VWISSRKHWKKAGPRECRTSRSAENFELLFESHLFRDEHGISSAELRNKCGEDCPSLKLSAPFLRPSAMVRRLRACSLSSGY
jgi:hypothetical protein